jgi:hypothetical protein
MDDAPFQALERDSLSRKCYLQIGESLVLFRSSPLYPQEMLVKLSTTANRQMRVLLKKRRRDVESISWTARVRLCPEGTE